MLVLVVERSAVGHAVVGSVRGADVLVVVSRRNIGWVLVVDRGKGCWMASSRRVEREAGRTRMGWNKSKLDVSGFAS